MTDSIPPTESGLRADPIRFPLAQGVGDEVSQLITTARNLANQGLNEVHPELQAAGLYIMRWLSTHGPTQAGKIAEALHMDKSAVSRQTRSLREFGFVTSEQDPSDGRAMVVRLTPLGQGKLDGRKQVSRERFYSRLEDWSADELNSLHDLLAKLNRSKPFGE